MDDLIKALKCCEAYYKSECSMECKDCQYFTGKRRTVEKLCNDAAKKINALEKSNRTWRRKCQRLRHELKEVKKNGVS